ncbi:MAG: signal peptidase II [Candidatus Sericytochromatia bacterium]|nr:signal peptidase II [Candidatus Sericytochromatia bacterium]
MKNRQATLLVYALALLWLIGDLWSKYAVSQRFLLGEVHSVIPNWLALTLAHNTGGAWSMLAGNPRLLGLVSAAVCIGIIVYERKFFPRNMAQSFALALLLGGAAGNMVDRLRLGYVVDMIYVQWHGQYFFPIFNVADVGINVGVALLVLTSMFAGQPTPAKQPEQQG